MDITRGVQDVVTLVRKEAALIASEASRSHRAVDSARHCLEGAFADHERACKAADAAHAASRHTASSSISPLHSKQHAAGTPLDPWLTEARWGPLWVFASRMHWASLMSCPDAHCCSTVPMVRQARLCVFLGGQALHHTASVPLHVSSECTQEHIISSSDPLIPVKHDAPKLQRYRL